MPSTAARAHRPVLAVGILATALLTAVAGCSSEAASSSTPEWASLYASDHWWMSATAPYPEDAWIVGGTADRGAILHYDGAGFEFVEHGADAGLFNWIHSLGPGDLIIVGNGGAVLRGDGTTWSLVDVPTAADLWGVWGTESDIWAVGGTPGRGAPTVMRDTGDGFVEVAIPPLTRQADTFFKVWGSGPDDVYIVGQRGAVLHWDGSVLTEVETGVDEDLIGIWGTGPDRIALAGGRATGVVALWDGREWRALAPAGLAGLNGVWFDGDQVHAVGVAGSAALIDFPSGSVSDYLIDTSVFLHALAGSPDGALLAVGGDFSTGIEGPFRGEILRADPLTDN